MPRNKNKKKFKKKPEAIFSAEKFRKIIATASGAAFLIFLIYFGANNHYNQKINYRIQKRSQILSEQKENYFEVTDESKIRSLPFFTKIRYATKLEFMEMDVEASLDEFVESMDKSNSVSLDRLTNADYERCGLIVKRREKYFEVKFQTNAYDIMRTYVSKALKGDISNRRELLAFFDERPSVFPKIEHRQILSDMLLVMDLYEKNKRDRKPYVIFEYESENRSATISWENLEFLHKDYEKYFKTLEKKLKGLTMQAVSPELFEKETFATFHTHPLNSQRLDVPSPSDRASTFLAGPNFLFVQHKGTFHCYLINKGDYKEIYSRNLQD